MKTYEFDYNRSLGEHIKLVDNGEVRREPFRPRFSSEIKAKRAELEAQGYTEKVSPIISAMREAKNKDELETVLCNSPIPQKFRRYKK